MLASLPSVDSLAPLFHPATSQRAPVGADMERAECKCEMLDTTDCIIATLPLLRSGKGGRKRAGAKGCAIVLYPVATHWTFGIHLCVLG